MICPCLKVDRDDIVEAIDNGASNFKDVKKKTKIVTKCGKCKTKAKCLVREIFAEKDLLIEGEKGVCLGCQGDFFEPEEGNENLTKEEVCCCKSGKDKFKKDKKKKDKKKKSKKKKEKEQKNKKKAGKKKKEDRKKEGKKKKDKHLTEEKG